MNDGIRADLEEAVMRLHHRGPDDTGIWINDIGVALGHTRLSILDLSPLGHQPMVSEDGRFVILFNGEIYNFRDIQTELTSLGHSFHGTGDTEVILHAFREWGPNAVTRFIGMFAIALWDRDEQSLDLIRDRIGVKPLYYGWDGQTLWFGSDLKSLRAFRHRIPRIDKRSLGEYLQYGYIAGDRTIYEGIYRLRPGHRLRLISQKAPKIEQYWSVLTVLGQTMPGSDQEIESALEQLLIDAFKYRMVSDVPVGVYLSGGVDSSLVTAILAKHCDQPIRTFTIGFREDSHDESNWAKKVAHHCGTIHTEYILGVDEALAIAKDWGELFDEPFGDPSGIPTLLVSRLAREQVKVVLSADGGDELFSGYNTYASVLARARRLSAVPLSLSRSLAAGLQTTSPRRLGRMMAAAPVPMSRFGALLGKVDRFRRMLADPVPGHMFDVYNSRWHPDEISRLIGHYESPRKDADAYPGATAEQLSLWDFHNYLPEDVLTKVDRTTMAVSIEGREPLLDHRLAEFAFRMPPHLRRGRLGPKHVLKNILYRYVPRPLVDRPKHGFGIPLDGWLRTDLRELAMDYLAEGRIKSAGIMDCRLMQRLVKNFYSGNSNLTTPLWLVIAFEMWREKWGAS